MNLQDIVPPAPHSDSVTLIASSLSTIAIVLQALYARHKGRKRDPLVKNLDERVKKLEEQGEDHGQKLDSIDEKVEDVEKKLDEILRRMNGADETPDLPSALNPSKVVSQ